MKHSSFLILFLLLVTFGGCKKGNGINEEIEETEDTSIDTSRVPFGLPKRIAFGTEGDISQSTSYIKETDYQYQYLAGDIFSNGWTTWNSPTGDFAKRFLVQIGNSGKIPVFTYYNLVPAKMRNQDPALANLADAEVMNKYFEDWKLLLQICSNYGKKVIIHVEPDLLGYMQMFKNDPTKSVIRVSESNYSDVKSFTNDAKGFAQAIVSMRNTYAPNVLLGWHASQWATGYDVIKGKHNPEQLAVETAAYYKSLNARFDIIFSEFTDRDAGYEQVVNGKTNAAWSTEGNAENGNLSDFERFRRFLKKLNRQTGQKIILWQIPVGNSLTNTCNNSRGHFKDNKAEYFLQPVAERANLDKLKQYGDAGVIAFLFGRGAHDCTSFMDTKGDGITGTNETSDDDGGYLRKSVKAYYQQGAVILQ
ncbi:hypothetical protein ACFQ3S_04240 [Mucilaginibacter terrae]|uniref:hypothetical protein n=1 Tax=Mucilaginibacter terrae TaxID=1955052 RepID=UPI0036338D14